MPFDLLTGESAVMFARKKLKRRRKDNLQGAERKNRHILLLKIFFEVLFRMPTYILFIALQICALTRELSETPYRPTI